MNTQSASITLYENEVPAFAGAELERLYSNLFSSLPMLSVNNAAFANTYVSSAKGTANHLFLFEKKIRWFTYLMRE